MGITIQDLERAVSEVFSGLQVNVFGELTEVPVFIDKPDPEEFPNPVFPSIDLQFLDLRPENALDESYDDYVVALDKTQTPFKATVRRPPAFYRIKLRVDSWALDADTDRQLVFLINTRKTPKDAIEVFPGEHVWFFFVSFQSYHTNLGDGQEYHNVWTFDLLAPLENSDTDAPVKQVHEIAIHSNLVKVGLDNDGKMVALTTDNVLTTAQNAELTPDRTVVFNDVSYWFE